MKQSIKEISTSGMDLYERRQLLKKYEMIPVGEIVYKAGDAWDWTEVLVVTEDNQEQVTMFWNALYFDNKYDADTRSSRAHAEYGEYQEMAIKGIGMAWY